MMNRKRSSRKYCKRNKSWTRQCKDYLRQFIAFLFSNVGIICLVVGYTLAGACLFKSIETPTVDPDNNNTTANRLMYAHDTAVNTLWSKVSDGRLNPLNETKFKLEIIQELLALQDSIVYEIKEFDYDGEYTIMDRWTIAASSLYCLTVITTIGHHKCTGWWWKMLAVFMDLHEAFESLPLENLANILLQSYGNVAPRTTWGKVATVVYAIFGMPLFLLYLSNIGDLFAKSFKWLYAKICLCKMCRMRRKVLESVAVVDSNSWRNTPEESWQNKIDRRAVGEVTEGEESDDEDTESSESSSSMPTEDPQDITVPISLCLTIMIGYISSGAILFANWETLNFRDGSYFCFISLSTIGFGDIVPTTGGGQGVAGIADSDNNFSSIVEMKFIFCSVYLMLGMALIAMCFNLMQQDVVQKIRTCSDIIRRIARCRR